MDITYNWRFENGVIKVVEHYQDYLGSKKDNCAFVEYIDNEGYEAVEPLLTERLNKQIESSKLEIDNNRTTRELQEREQARIKEEKQKAALESI